jgi:hypothetical protein
MAKAKPGQLNLVSAGAGAGTHFAGEMQTLLRACCFGSKLHTDLEPGKVMTGEPWPSSVAARSSGAFYCPVARVVPVADECTFW